MYSEHDFVDPGCAQYYPVYPVSATITRVTDEVHYSADAAVLLVFISVTLALLKTVLRGYHIVIYNFLECGF